MSARRRRAILGLVAAAVLGLVLYMLLGPRTHAPTGRVPEAERQAAAPRRATLPATTNASPDADVLVDGLVLDPSGRPAADAVVELDDDSAPLRTGPDGRFQLRRPPGAVRLRAHAGEAFAGPWLVRLTPPSRQVTLQLRAGMLVEVKVVAAGDRAPIAGAEVTAVLQGGALLADEMVLTATTDATGRAHLPPTRHGPYALQARADGYAPASANVHFERCAAWRCVEVMTLSPATPLRGRVVASGRGVAGATVWTVAGEPEPRLDRQLAVTSDEQGEFVVPWAARGAVLVYASHPSYRDGKAGPVLIVPGVEPPPVEVVLAAGGRVHGRVVTRDGVPVAAKVMAAPAGSMRVAVDPAMPLGRSTVGSATGEFAIDGLLDGTYQVYAVGYGGRSEPREVEVSVDRAAAAVELVLTDDGVLAGQVVDAGARPVSDALVRFRAAGTSESWRHARAQTDGRFRLEDLVPGAEYELAAVSLRRPMLGNDYDGPTSRARVGALDVVLVVEPEAEVRGRVAYRDGGAPARFTVAVPGVERRAVASSDGAFAIPGVPAGVWMLVVDGPDFPRRMQPLVVQRGRDVDLGVLEVDRGREIHGRVLTPRREPVAGAEVDVYADPSLRAPAGVTRSDEDGHFSLPAPRGVPAWLKVRDRGVRGSEVIAVPASGDDPIEVVLPPACEVRGVVVSGGVPVPDAAVFLSDARYQTAFTTDLAGRFAMEASPGELVLSVFGPGSRQAVRFPLRVGEGGADVVLDLRAPERGATPR